MSDIEKVRLFDNQKIRTVWVEEDEEWYFSVKDVVTILTETTNAKDYISKMRRRDEELSKGWGQIVHPLTVQPAAGIVSARRGGTTAAFDQVNKYFTISSMPVVSSKYWNMVHGSNPDQVRQDEEGMQVMRELGRNMAWMLKCIEAGKAAGIEPPKKEIPVQTNFIR